MRVSAAWAVALALGAVPAVSAGYMPRKQRDDGREEPKQPAGGGRGDHGDVRRDHNSLSASETPSPVVSTIDATALPTETTAAVTTSAVPAEPTPANGDNGDDGRNGHQPSLVTVSASMSSSVGLAPTTCSDQPARQTEIIELPIELPIESLPFLSGILSGLLPIQPATTVTHTIFQMAPASLLTVTHTVTALPSGAGNVDTEITTSAPSASSEPSGTIISASQSLASSETITGAPPGSETIISIPLPLTSSETTTSVPPSSTCSKVTVSTSSVETSTPSTSPLTTPTTPSVQTPPSAPAVPAPASPSPVTEPPVAPPAATPLPAIINDPFPDAPPSLFSSVLSLGPPTGGLSQGIQAAPDLALPRATSVALVETATSSLPASAAPAIHVGALSLLVSLAAMVLAV